MNAQRIFPGAAMLVAALLSSRNFYGLPGIARVPQSVERSLRYGIEHEIPHVVGIQYLRGDVYKGLYWSPFDISYSWDRSRAFGASFQIRFPPNRFQDGPLAKMDREAVERFITTWPDASPHEMVSVDLKDDSRFGPNGFYFEYTTRATNPGNLGFLTIDEGYLFVHPFDPDHLIMIFFTDYFNPGAGKGRDQVLATIAKEWFASIRIGAPTEEEKSYMRRSNWEWVQFEGKIPN